MTAEIQPPTFVLVRPQMGENVGAAARAMLNFGLSRLRVVAPRDGWPNPRAVAMASGAARVLDAAGRFDALPEAVADCEAVFATTARPRDLSKEVLTPEAATARLREMAGQGRRAAILFGPERTGLENDDVALANAIVTVPVNPDFPSLNLAQCALLMAYEWGRQGGAPPPARHEGTAASHAEVAALADRWEERLDAAGFFFPPQKAPHMKRNVRNLWSRMPLERGDVQILHGMLRQLVRRREG